MNPSEQNRLFSYVFTFDGDFHVFFISGNNKEQNKPWSLTYWSALLSTLGRIILTNQTAQAACGMERSGSPVSPVCDFVLCVGKVGVQVK